MSIKHTLRLGTALVAVGIAALDSTAQAQEQGLEEIVVTAQRRTESLQTVPIAVSAFTATELERRNITSTLNLVQYVPNLVGHNNTGLGTANTYYIRGSGNTESLATQDPPVGTYVDDIYISRQSANNFSLFDVERVEVLRGPQGTLFGRNTTGGAISVILKTPGEELGGFGEASYGRFERISLRGSIDLPVSDKVRTKISGYYMDDKGYVKNVTTNERLNSDDGYGVRGAFSVLANDAITWNAAVMHTHAESDNIVNFDCNPANVADCDGRFVTTGLRKNNNGQSQVGTLVVANGKGNLPLGSSTDFTLLSSNLEANLGDVTLNAITGYSDVNQDYIVDFFDGRTGPTFAFTLDPTTGRPTTANIANNIIAIPPVRGFTTGGFTIANIARSHQFTQEVKATGQLMDGMVDYVAGAFYLDESNFTDFADIFNSTGTPLLLADRIVRNGTEAWAGYAQVDVNATDMFKVTAGIRYTNEKKDFSFADNRATCAVTPLPATCLSDANFGSVDVDLNAATPGIRIPRDQQAKIWTPRFALNFTPNDDVLLFASATRGFKSGSQSGRATAVRLLLPFGPEKVWAYEAGAKTEWMDNRLRFNVTGFIQDTTDLQVGVASVNALTGALSFTTRNFAGLQAKGLEIEAEAAPVDGLILSLTAGFQDSEYKIDPTAPALDAFNVLSVGAQQRECQAALAGAASPRGDTRTAVLRAQGSCGAGILKPDGTLADPVRSPKATIAGGINYTYPISSGLEIVPSVNVVYTSKQQVGVTNLSFFRSSAGTFNVTGDGDFISGALSKAHTVVNASIGLQDTDSTWKVVASCDNCFGVTYVQSTLSNYSYLNQPSTWSLRVRRNF